MKFLCAVAWLFYLTQPGSSLSRICLPFAGSQYVRVRTWGRPQWRWGNLVTDRDRPSYRASLKGGLQVLIISLCFLFLDHHFSLVLQTKFAHLRLSFLAKPALKSMSRRLRLKFCHPLIRATMGRWCSTECLKFSRLSDEIRQANQFQSIDMQYDVSRTQKCNFHPSYPNEVAGMPGFYAVNFGWNVFCT